jgi:tartrate dehydrogenase/decarboxylase/D-malate dehydrogenase
MLEFLGHQDAHDAILTAIKKVLSARPANAPLTRDMGGTVDLGKANAAAL